jgi:hypothetical protein
MERQMDARTGGRSDVLALLTQQRDLCRQLSGYAERQRPLVTGDRPEQLLAALGERQILLDQLGGVVERMRPYQRNWREVRTGMAAEEGRRADALLAEVNTLLGGILQQDEADAKLLSARKASTAREMGQLKQTRAAGAAYATAGGYPATGTYGPAAGGGHLDWTAE